VRVCRVVAVVRHGVVVAGCGNDASENESVHGVRSVLVEGATCRVGCGVCRILPARAPVEQCQDD
jgi:hypothetical protein